MGSDEAMERDDRPKEGDHAFLHFRLFVLLEISCGSQTIFLFLATLSSLSVYLALNLAL